MEKVYKRFLTKVKSFKKAKLLFTLLFSLTFAFSNAQVTVQLGSGTSTTSYTPNYYNFNYSYSQVIYTAAELTAAGAPAAGGLISKIKYKPTSTVATTNWRDWVVYIGNTSQVGFTSNTSWIPLAGMNEVFNGQIPANVTAGQWMEITLTTPFAWDGTSNLVVAVDENTPTYGGSPGWQSYTLAPSTGSKGIYKYADPTDIDPASPPTASSTSNSVAQIQFEMVSSIPCSGTPTGGTTVLTPTIGNMGSPITGSVSGSDLSFDLTYQWQYSDDNGATWNDIVGQTNSSLSTTAMWTIGTRDYRRAITCPSSAVTSYSTPVTFTTQMVYCTPIYTTGCSGGSTLNGVTTANGSININNTGTGCSSLTALAYNDYSATQTVETYPGASFDITAAISNYSGGVKVWIDYNQNGTYEATELVAASTSTILSGSSFTATVNVPGTALLGTTRMRVRVVEGSTVFDACESKSYGETEDYAVTLVAPPTCMPVTAVTATLNGSSSANVTWIAGASEASWNVSWGTPGYTPGGAGEIGTTTVSTNSATVPGLTSNTNYDIYVQADCGSGDLSTWTGPVSVYTGHCVPTGGTSYYVSAFATTNTLADINYSASSGVGYVDNTSTILETFAGNQVNFSMTPSSGSNYYYVWVDWNNDLDFDDAGETVLATTGYASNYSGNFIVPVGQPIGQYKMRVANSWSGTITACGPSTNGNYVDFTIDVQTIACYPPSALLATLNGLNTANVIWTAGASEASWNVSWGTPGYTPGGAGEIGTTTVSTNSATIPGLTSDTNYDIYVQSDCGSGDLSIWTGPVSVYTGYCIPIYTSTSDYTSAFSTTGAIQNVTHTASSFVAYTNKSAIDTIKQVIGNSFNFSHSYIGGSNTVKIWVDWGNDGVFDATDVVFLSSPLGGSATQTGTITIPLTATAGNYRMRIRSRFSSTNPGPCSSESFGSALDYTLTVFDLPTAPTITQSAATPDCLSGTDLTATGTAGANEVWYWQTTASGTSTADDATTPWTVFVNGTYYVRTFNTLYNVWSNANSITISNIPTAPAPPTPVAAQNPVCLPGTQISVPAAPTGLEYFWQGTDNMSSSTADPASTPYDVTATGTYYVKAYDAATSCWSEPEGITVTVDSYTPAAPTANPAEYFVCSGATTQLIVANAPASGNAIGTNPATGSTMYLSSVTTSSLSDCAIPVSVNVPVGATITGVDVSYTMTASSANYAWISEQRSYLKCISPAGVAETTVANGVGSSPGTYSYNRTNLTIANGVSSTGVVNFELHAFTTYGDAGCTTDYSQVDPNTLTVTVNYMFPTSTVNWYDAATAGNNIGTGSPLESVGTTVLANPATAGSYSFYAESVSGGCTSATRTLITVDVSNVNVDLLPVDASCNNGNDGSFLVSGVDCGSLPFTFAVDGGAFGPIPTDLFAGQHTVQVKASNGDLSSVYTITIGGAAGPSNLAVTSYTSDEATIIWTANGSETSWNVEWGAPGFTPGTGTEIGSGVANSTTFTITGLNGETEYDIYVSTNCGGPTADWAQTDVETDCNPIAAIGFCEDFEVTSSTLDCWSTIDGDNNGTSDGIYAQWTLFNNTDWSEDLAISGEQFGVNFNQSQTGADDYLITPRLTLTNNEVMMFNYTTFNYPASFKVMLSTTGKNIADFTEVLMAETTFDTDRIWKDTSINLNAYAGDVYIAFVRSGLTTTYSGVGIEDVCIDICVPQQGVDGTVDVCRLDNTIDLNTVITPQYPTGVWTFPANQSVINGSIMNVSTMANGTYQVYYIVTTACTADTTVATIKVFNPSSAGENGLLTACKNQPIDLYGGLNGNVDFGGTWYRPNGAVMTGSYFTTGTLVGQQVYRYIVSNGVCGTDTAEVTVNIQNCDYLGLDDLSLLDNVTIAPNPSTGNFQLLGIPGADYTFEVLDLNGRVVRNAAKITSTITDVNLTDVEDGVYMVRISGNGSERMIRVIKQK